MTGQIGTQQGAIAAKPMPTYRLGMPSGANWSMGKQAWRKLPHPVRWIGVAIVGGVLVVLGLVMMVTPGPGIPVLILGLVILATEFAWAERTLHKVRDGSGRAYRAARDRLRKS